MNDRRAQFTLLNLGASRRLNGGFGAMTLRSVRTGPSMRTSEPACWIARLSRDEIAVAPLVLPHVGRVVQVSEQLFEQGLALLRGQLDDLARHHLADVEQGAAGTWMTMTDGCRRRFRVFTDGLQEFFVVVAAPRLLAGDVERVEPMDRARRSSGSVSHAWPMLTNAVGTAGCSTSTP